MFERLASSRKGLGFENRLLGGKGKGGQVRKRLPSLFKTKGGGGKNMT